MKHQRYKNRVVKYAEDRREKKLRSGEQTYDIEVSKPRKDFYNKYEFLQACKYMNSNPSKTADMLKDYIDKYPMDTSALIYYGYALVCIGNLEEAKKQLEAAIEARHTNSIFLIDKERREKLDHDLMILKLRIVSYSNDPKGALQYFLSLPKELKNELGNNIPFFFKGELGLFDKERREPNTYLFRQIVDYQEEDFREHIKKHLADFNGNDKEISESFFAPDFPIDEVIEEVKKHIPGEPRIRLGYYEDVYIFKYDGCGIDYNKKTDYFKVVTFLDSARMITMCPTEEEDYLDPIDLNDIRKNHEPEEEKAPVKKLSQIDKFYNRYNRANN